MTTRKSFHNNGWLFALIVPRGRKLINFPLLGESLVNNVGEKAFNLLLWTWGFRISKYDVNEAVTFLMDQVLFISILKSFKKLFYITITDFKI